MCFFSWLNQPYSDELPAFFTRPHVPMEAQLLTVPHYSSPLLFVPERIPILDLVSRPPRFGAKSSGPVNATKNRLNHLKLNIKKKKSIL